MPRRYDLGKRLDEKVGTRRRIVAAASELYRERGASHTSMTEVARRANVAPSTVTNHFATADALARAVAEHILGELRMPEPELLEGLTTLAGRIRALSDALGAFYVRSEPWYQIPQLEAHPIAAWQEAEAGYEAALDNLIRLALGPLATDDEAVGMVRAMLEPAVFVRLRAGGESTTDAAKGIADVLSVWLAAREASVRR